MSGTFTIYHLKQSGDPNLPLDRGYWHMATCLRSIVISDQSMASRPKSLKDHKVMRNEEAYEFLLQVICGLHSPLLGETEVLGQFKEFVRSRESEFSPDLRLIVNALMKDAKSIRHQFLQNLGCSSYGSLLRKHMRDDNEKLTILGAGSLARDILPWFSKQKNKVSLFTRSPEKHNDIDEMSKMFEVKHFSGLQMEAAEGVLVVASPVSALWVEQNVDLQQFSRVYDLRGISDRDPLEGSHVMALKELFAQIENNKKQVHTVKERALDAIKNQAQSLILMERPRPFGWDDLWSCA